MLLLRVWNFLRGYVIINVSGNFIEKFINLCANKGVYIWDIKRKSYNDMTLKVSTNGFKALKNIANKTKCKIKVKEKIGLPFIKFKYRQRKTFVAGFIIFILIIYLLSSFIWVIEIKGAKKVDPQKIIDFLDQHGIKPGIIKYKIDEDKIVPKMLIAIEDISWADIKLVGTKVIVNIAERIPKPPVIDEDTPCNILAKKDGVIQNIVTKNGKELVKSGEVVRKGQVLITGVIENDLNPEKVRYVHSQGTIKATTWYQDTLNVRTIQVKRKRTGKCKSGYGIKLFSDYYNVFRSQSPYKIYDKENKSIRLSLWKNFDLPVKIVINKYHKVRYNKYILSKQEAKKLGKNKLYDKLENKIPEEAKIVNKKIKYKPINDNIIKAKATYECIEDIGYKEKIIKNREDS